MAQLHPGDPAPTFTAPALGGNPAFRFDSVAGRPVVLLFAGSAGSPPSVAALETVAAHRAMFDDRTACLFGISTDPEDVAQGRIAPDLPGIRWFLDGDGAVSRLYGAIDEPAADGSAAAYRPHWVLLDRMLRVVSRAPIGKGSEIMAALSRLVALEGGGADAPVLVVPRILEPEVCRRLIELYEATGGTESGFMREVNGVTVHAVDHGHKRRADCTIEDPALLAMLRARLNRFLRPMIARAFQFEPTRVERWIVACYDGDNGGGHFRAHRDNTTRGTAHRKFACTINLNAEEYDGGELRFPEFGPKSYRAPTGGAVVFSCSLLHEALPVTRGKRYAFLPFFYDEAGARLREANLRYVSPELAHYRSGLPADAETATP